MFLALLTSLNCYMSITLRLEHYDFILTPACLKSNNTNAGLMAFALCLALDPIFGIHSHKTVDTGSTLSSFKAKLKTFLFSQYFHPN